MRWLHMNQHLTARISLTLLLVGGALLLFPLLILWMPGFFAFVQSLLAEGRLEYPRAIPRALAYAFLLFALAAGARDGYKDFKGLAPTSALWKAVGMLAAAVTLCYAMAFLGKTAG